MGEGLNSILQSPIFESIKEDLEEISNQIKNAELVQLMAPADLDGILALAQLEASFLDLSLHYRRRVLSPRKFVGRDHIEKIPEVDGLIIDICAVMESQSSIEVSNNVITIFPISVPIKIGSSNKGHQGAIDCTAICAALAELICPTGARVRKQRPMAIGGSWLRQSVDVNYDPILSLLRDHLDKEGSIDICPLPEVPDPITDMIPGFSVRMLSRLTKGWAEMDFEQRSSAISELVLPVLRNSGISTMRLEELIWHRLMIPGEGMDIASQVYKTNSNWPEDVESAKIHSSTITDHLITQGKLV